MQWFDHVNVHKISWKATNSEFNTKKHNEKKKQRHIHWLWSKVENVNTFIFHENILYIQSEPTIYSSEIVLINDTEIRKCERKVIKVSIKCNRFILWKYENPPEIFPHSEAASIYNEFCISFTINIMHPFWFKHLSVTIDWNYLGQFDNCTNQPKQETWSMKEKKKYDAAINEVVLVHLYINHIINAHAFLHITYTNILKYTIKINIAAVSWNKSIIYYNIIQWN